MLGGVPDYWLIYPDEDDEKQVLSLNVLSEYFFDGVQQFPNQPGFLMTGALPSTYTDVYVPQLLLATPHSIDDALYESDEAVSSTQEAGRLPFGELVLGCIDADFCNEILILQHYFLKVYKICARLQRSIVKKFAKFRLFCLRKVMMSRNELFVCVCLMLIKSSLNFTFV